MAGTGSLQQYGGFAGEFPWLALILVLVLAPGGALPAARGQVLAFTHARVLEGDPLADIPSTRRILYVGLGGAIYRPDELLAER